MKCYKLRNVAILFMLSALPVFAQENKPATNSSIGEIPLSDALNKLGENLQLFFHD